MRMVAERFGCDEHARNICERDERRARALARFLTWTSIGIAAMAAPVAGMLLWLERKHALGAWSRRTRLLPAYAMQERRPFGFTLSQHLATAAAGVAVAALRCAARTGVAGFERLLIATGLRRTCWRCWRRVRRFPTSDIRCSRFCCC